MVFIVSTTGDGEPPDNALQFVKSIKKKTSDHYKHLCYALLGKFYDEVVLLESIGDTDFQNMSVYILTLQCLPSQQAVT